ncbi:uncharacterized protein [Eurosta solidaginis]|uniref:uncharacterized protein n=1 Tax=Eurosta solidaginis TaxID=178769 RepID=UPI003530AFF1
MPKAKAMQSSAGKGKKRAGESRCEEAKTKKNKNNAREQETMAQAVGVQMLEVNPEIVSGEVGPSEQVTMAQAVGAQMLAVTLEIVSGAVTGNTDVVVHIQGEIKFIVAQIQRQADWLASATLDDMSVEVLKTHLDILNRAWGRFEVKDRELRQISPEELQRADGS